MLGCLSVLACGGEGALPRGSAAGPTVAAAGQPPSDGLPAQRQSTSDTAESDDAIAGEPAEGGGRFVLAWQDDFDAFDAGRWQLMTHTWDSNLAQFSTENTSFADGVASLRLTAAAGDPTKPYRGVEMRSRATLTYGKVEARVRFAGGSGIVSSLVLLYTPWPADDWNELDVEFLGRYSDRIQFNAMIYAGPPTTPPVTTSVSPTQFPEIVPLQLDPSAGFHVYAVEWTPSEVRFRVDGVVARRWSERIELMRLPQNVLLTIWASSAAAWAGPVDPTHVPAAAEYDWLRVYDWLPE